MPSAIDVPRKPIYLKGVWELVTQWDYGNVGTRVQWISGGTDTLHMSRTKWLEFTDCGSFTWLFKPCAAVILNNITTVIWERLGRLSIIWYTSVIAAPVWHPCPWGVSCFGCGRATKWFLAKNCEFSPLNAFIALVIPSTFCKWYSTWIFGRHPERVNGNHWFLGHVWYVGMTFHEAQSRNYSQPTYCITATNSHGLVLTCKRVMTEDSKTLTRAGCWWKIHKYSLKEFYRVYWAGCVFIVFKLC